MLEDVYSNRLAPAYLYELLRNRLDEPETNISHRALPSYEEHLVFFRSRPYEHWYLVYAASACVGACYLTKAGEIGIYLVRAARGQGSGAAALRELMARHPRERFLANLNPGNAASAALFQKLGFKLIQHTYEAQNVAGLDAPQRPFCYC